LSVSSHRFAPANGSIESVTPPLRGFFLTADEKAAVAVTDSGRQVPLFRYELAVSLGPGQEIDAASYEQQIALLRFSEQQFLQNAHGDSQQLVRVADPSLSTNSHGWVFLSGRIGIKDEHIAQLLIDNGYQPAGSPQPGDVAIYREGSTIVHSGLVVNGEGNGPLVDSKWGPFSVFRHPADKYYRGDCTFYRSRRQGHMLAVHTTGKTPKSRSNQTAASG